MKRSINQKNHYSFYTLDLTKFENSKTLDKKKLANQVDRACTETGFLLISNHGISQKTIDEMWFSVDSFFKQNINEKLKVSAPNKGYPYGYFMSETESLAKSKGLNTPPDLKESFNGGPLKPPIKIKNKDALNFCYAPTIWPNINNFKTFWSAYYKEMEKLAERIMKVFALALNIDENYFESYIDNPISALRALNYPSIKRNVLPKQQRAGAHTDYGSLTILLPQEKSKGLQIKISNKWVDVPIAPNKFIINIGDLMALWTNDRWKSTLHRVKPYKKSRKSLAFFHQPNWDAEIKVLESCVIKKKKYNSVFSGPYLMSKFKSTK